ncbi:putative cytochrome P450 [Naematelia encephala]|uniref:Putative cytochrome P450 n=1 Tax=Naematelia encephala TaxID=71784 RepID=A0A1Y2BMT4_9TREE|nr:putative cytochrome P450 [Naematelia encephala]
MTMMKLSLSQLTNVIHNVSWSCIWLYNLSVICMGLVVIIASIVWREWTIAHYNLQGPPSTHWFYGNLQALLNAPTGTLQARWISEYGPVFAFTSIFRRPEIMITDPHTIGYIYNHPERFDRAISAKKILRYLTGHSVIAVDEPDHRRMRKAILPSFAPAHIKELMPIFFQKTYELKDRLLDRLSDDRAEVDATKYISETTVDIVGLGGFSYDFEALSSEGNELLQAWTKLRDGIMTRNWVSMLQFAGVPGANWFGYFTKRQKGARAARDAMFSVGERLVQEKKRLVLAETRGEIKKVDVQGMDLLTVLVRANMASDVRSEQHLSDDELISQIPLFLLAGNATTTMALTWSLVVLAKNAQIQDELRADCMSLANEQPSLDQLNSLPYLEAFIRELLRVYPSTPAQVRVVTKDEVLPLSTPVRSREGRMMDVVHVKKGTGLTLALFNVHMSTELFGPDAAEFRPERWLDPGMNEKVKKIPGMWANLLTFGGGDRSCIGFRFAIAEMKAVLFTLIRHMAFEETEEKPEVVRVGGLGISRPVIPGRDDIPIVIRRLA